MKLIAQHKINRPTNAENQWKKELYTELDIDYPKFYKMDALAKMAFICFQHIAPKINLEKYGDEDIALIFANSTSSQDTDEKFIDSYEQKGSPSPSLFVYTLPNILTGELSILNKWYGENIFFISEKFDAEFFIDQINFYFRKGAKACLCGWVNANAQDETCFLFFVSNEDGEFTPETLTKYYNQ